MPSVNTRGRRQAAHSPHPRRTLLALCTGVAALLPTLFAVAQAPSGEAPTFADVASIFKENCVGCHGGPEPTRGLSLESYAGVMKGAGDVPVVKPGDPKGSILVQRLRGELQPQMPFGSDPLPEETIQKVEAWIAAGAKEGGASGETAEPTLPRPGEPVRYTHVKAIFASRCTKCHAEAGLMGGPPEGYRLDGYDHIVGEYDDYARVVPGNPSGSLLVRIIKGQSRPRMPFDGPPYLSDDEIRVIGDWVAQGAPDDNGRPAPMPVGARVRLEGRLTAYWRLDDLALVVNGRTRVDESPRVGSRVEVRGEVLPNGQILATRIEED